MINERLKTALTKNESEQEQAVEELIKVDGNGHSSTESEIVTTEEEKEAFLILKSILRQKLSPDRVRYRDAKSYFAVLFEDNNRKPLCRLRFNSKTKQIGLFDADKTETRYPIEMLDDIYQYSDQLLKTVDFYLEKAES